MATTLLNKNFDYEMDDHSSEDGSHTHSSNKSKACRCYTAVHLVGLGNNILTMAVLFDCGMRNKQLMATAGQAKALWQR